MLYKDKLYGTFERKDEEPGPFKVFAYLLLENGLYHRKEMCLKPIPKFKLS